jgi:O-acetyl-ADP-ribose deacetylase (regulator of RNase III)
MQVIQGDITTVSVDVIVNAANSSLLGGGGVDGAIHRAAGPALLEACRRVRQEQGDCPPGHAVITTAGKLPAKAVVHTVGPVWHGGDDHDVHLLEDAYRNSLMLAEANNYESIAFPAISTGVYGYPKAAAAKSPSIPSRHFWLTIRKYVGWCLSALMTKTPSCIGDC